MMMMMTMTMTMITWLPGAGEGQNSMLPKDHDIVFFFGDLNYRIEGLSYEQTLDGIRQQKWDTLWKHV